MSCSSRNRHSRGRTPVRGIRPSLLGSRRRDLVNDSWQDVHSYPRIKARSPPPFAHNGDNEASTSEGGENTGRGLRNTGIQRKPIKR